MSRDLLSASLLKLSKTHVLNSRECNFRVFKSKLWILFMLGFSRSLPKNVFFSGKTLFRSFINCLVGFLTLLVSQKNSPTQNRKFRLVTGSTVPNPALKNPIEIPTSALKLILFELRRLWSDLYDISLLTDRQIFEYNLWLKITYSNESEITIKTSEKSKSRSKPT